jgi:F420H(2)-dependent quinone reductase
MLIRGLERREAEFYRRVNQIVEPLVRAGVGSPGLWPAGLIVVEIRGRKTGRTFNVPLLATLVGHCMLVSTVRRRSQWVKNLVVNPEVRYWRGGRIGEATAVVFAPGLETPRLDHLPPAAGCLATALRPYSRMFGGGVAILIPKREKAAN